MGISVRSRLERLARALQAALAAGPGDAKSYVNLGRIEERLGFLEKAEERFQEAARLLPGSADVQLLLCENLAGQGREGQALKHCRRALRLDPGRAGTHLIMGTLLAGLGRAEAAEKHFQQALDMAPSRPEAYIKCGELCLKQGRAREAAALLGKALALAPASAATRCLLDLAVKGHRPTEAGGVVIGRRPAVFEERLTRSISLWKSGRRRLAETRFQETLVLAPDNARVLLAYAEFCLDSGRPEAAEARLRQAWQGPGRGRLSRRQRAAAIALLFRVGKAYQARGLDRKALLLFKESLALAPDDVAVRLACAEVCLDSGKVEAADAHLRQVLASSGWGRLDRGQREAVHFLLLRTAKAYQGRGLGRKALVLFKEWLPLAPDAAAARLACAEVCLDSGQVEAADAHLRQVLASAGWGRLDRGQRGAVSSLLLRTAKAYQGRGLAESAEALLRRGAAAGGDLELKMPFVEFLKDEGRYAEAARCLEASRKGPGREAAGDFQLGWVYGKLQRFGLMRDRFRSYLRRAPAQDEPLRRYRAWVALGDYRRAFRAAEEFIARAGNDPVLEELALPWPESWLRPYDRSFYERRLSALERWERGRRPSPWPAFLKTCIWNRMSNWDSGLAATGAPQLRCMEDLERLAAPSQKRYGWMLYFSGLGRLQLRDSAAARRDFAAAARSRPGFWWARCRLAESLLCLGRQREAFGVFTRLEDDLPEARPHVLAWHGEALLWTGRWQEAWDRLDQAIRQDSWLAVCWRGAANLLGGRLAAAGRDLDSAIVPESKDIEAFIWRGELRRRQGRLREAKSDLDEAIRLGDRQWGCWNRALLRAQAGDMRAMRDDLGMVDREVVRHVTQRLGLDGEAPRTDQEVLRVLKAGLRLALGVRRHDPYLREIWMRSGSGS